MLAVPQWFMDGMALSYAFPLDSIHYSRLLDMARHDRLYSLDQLSTILSQSTMVREEMTFQAHSMFEYWEKTYKKGAALDLMKSIFRKPAGFEKLFKAHFGVSLKEAYKSYRDYVCEKCGELKEKASAQEFEIEDHGAGGQFSGLCGSSAPTKRSGCLHVATAPKPTIFFIRRATKSHEYC